jgi:hypothetical protein
LTRHRAPRTGRLAYGEHAEALRSLGLAAGYAEREAVRAEEAALARRRKHAQRAMLAALKGVPIEGVPDGFAIKYGGDLPLPHEAAEAIVKRQAAHRERLLAEDPVGREVGRLEAEKDRLLDTVFLATSPGAIEPIEEG